MIFRIFGRTHVNLSSISSERERKRLHARVEKLNFERPVFDRSLLPEELIQPVLFSFARAALVRVDSMVRTRRGSIDLHAEAHCLAVLPWPQNQMQIARVESKNHFSWRNDQRRMPSAHVPVADQSPLIDGRAHRRAIILRFVLLD